MKNKQILATHAGLSQVRKWLEKSFFYPGPDEGKARKFYFESGKNNFLKKKSGNVDS